MKSRIDDGGGVATASRPHNGDAHQIPPSRSSRDPAIKRRDPLSGVDDLEIHPLCNCIPGLPQAELDRLADEIHRIGRSAPFLTAGGKIMERDRFLACKAAKVAIEFEPWDGFDSLVETIARLNLPRLYLTESQRAAVAVPISEQISTERSDRRTAGLLTEKWQRQATSEIASKTAFSANATVVLNLARRCNSPETQVGDSGSEYVRSVELAAQICHVSPAYITLAKSLRDESRDIFDMVLSGKLNLSQARLLASKNSRANQLSSFQLDSIKSNPNWVEDELFAADCLQKMPKMRDKIFPLIFADPPYNNGWKYDADPNRDNLPEQQYLDWSERWMRQCARLLTGNGSLFLMIDGNYQGRFDVILRNLGLHWRDTIIWHDNNPEYTDDKFQGAARFILYFTKSPSKIIWNPEPIREPSARDLLGDARRVHDRGRVPHNVWDIPRIPGNAAERAPFEDAPPQVPQKLLRRIILAASNPGDRIFDPFTGNGTTWRAAREAGRKFTGIERSKKYAEQAAKWVHANSISTAEARP